MALTNMPESSHRVSFNKSIDTVLDDTNDAETKAKQPGLSRPAPSTRPSWIGPPRIDRPLYPGSSKSLQKIEIAFTSPGLEPPVYIFTNLSEPAWEEVEMSYESDSNGKHHFKKVFEVEEGMYQYKFRLGSGDWWVCDNSKAVIFDNDGNRNNLVCVSALLNFSGVINQAKVVNSSTSTIESKSDSIDTKAENTNSADPQIQADHKETLVSIGTFESDVDHGDNAKGSSLGVSDGNGKQKGLDQVGPDQKSTAQFSTSDDAARKEDYVHPGITTDGKTYWDEYGVPLLPHEVRLYFPNADMSHHPWDLGRQELASSSDFPLVPEEADPNDLRHERFPTTREGIFALIRQLAARQAVIDAEAAVNGYQSIPPTTQQPPDQITVVPLNSVVEDEEDDEDDEELFENTRETTDADSDTKNSTTEEENSGTDVEAAEETPEEIEQNDHVLAHVGGAAEEIPDSSHLSAVDELVNKMLGGPVFALPTAIAIIALATAIATYSME